MMKWPCLMVVVCLAVQCSADESWAEKWCELNDCYGIRAAEAQKTAVAKLEKESKKSVRRYHTTGEIRAIKSEAVEGAYFQYDGPVLDHPAFPGVAAEHAMRAEKRHEAYAIAVRAEMEKRSLSPPSPTGGYLPPHSSEARGLAVRENAEHGVGIARRRHSVMREKTRLSCMYEYNQNPDGKGGYILGQITSIKAPVQGCAAGSVWEDEGHGQVYLASRTAESLGSVWRKVNGSEREWFEDAGDPPKDRPWVQSWHQWRGAQIRPYKDRAPGPCAPGYGGAFCKKELGTGADYVDEEDVPPPWANMNDVARLKAFWREQRALTTGESLPGVDLRKHREMLALPLAAGEYTAGTASSRGAIGGGCICKPDDFPVRLYSLDALLPF